MISVSPTAIKEIKRIQSQMTSVSPNLIELSVKSGGCSGMFYDLKIKSDNHSDSSATENLLEIEGIFFVTDSNSRQYLENLQLDYSEDLVGGAFRFHNPEVKDVCGCGISFSGKKSS